MWSVDDNGCTQCSCTVVSKPHEVKERLEGGAGGASGDESAGVATIVAAAIGTVALVLLTVAAAVMAFARNTKQHRRNLATLDWDDAGFEA